jgi:hypothetical protein
MRHTATTLGLVFVGVWVIAHILYIGRRRKPQRSPCSG